jgi:hypothetical protein
MTVLTAPSVEFEAPTDYRDELRARPDRVRWLRIPSRRYLAEEGFGVPGDDDFRAAIAALYPVAYALHFALARRGIEAPVGTLQGRYEFAEVCHWQLLLPIPEVATADEIERVIQDVEARKQPARIDALRVTAWDEGLVAQIMHIGPYADETSTIERLEREIVDAGMRPIGLHHELYVNDPNRVAPSRMKTLLRQDVSP